MSNAPGTNNDRRPSSWARLIAEFEEEILETSDLIDLSLEENLVKPERNIKQHLVLLDLASALRTETEDERIHDLAQALLFSISVDPITVTEQLEDARASKSLVRLMSKLTSKYAAESTIPGRISQQGANYWVSMSVDLVKRTQSESLGMNYRIVRGHNETMELSMDLDSNLIFCGNLLDAHSQAIDEFGEQAVEQMDLYWLTHLQETLNYIQDQIDDLEENPGHSDNDDPSN